jgi:4'-phosphopantetheinyl transferase
MHAVDLYPISVKAERPWLARHWRLLDEAERQRAARYRREADRARFMLARTTLRCLLGRRLGLAPQALVFCSNPFGKLALPPPHALHFNTSHSGDWVLHAFSASAPVGVDVEAIACDWAALQPLDNVLAPAERDWLLSLRVRERPAAFAAIWVRKEAYVKAQGQGLSRPLREISVLPARGGAPERLAERGHDLHLEALSLCPLELGAGYAGCLAYLGPKPLLRFQHYRDALHQAAA